MLQQTFCWESGRGCELTIVPCLSDALDHLILSPPDAVVLDLFLPDSHGLETLRQMHLAATRIPIIVLAEIDNESLALRALQEGAQDYLVKGEFAARDMARALRYALERQRLRMALQSLIVTDELTQLHNRRGFFTVASHQLEVARRSKSTVLLLYADLDGLKEINDKLGHDEGDRALLEAADTLRASFRHSDVLARLGGDEFAVLAMDPGPVGSSLVLQRLRQSLQKRNARPSRRYLLSMSTGLEWCAAGGAYSLEELMARADSEMYRQKRKHHESAGSVVLARTTALLRPVGVSSGG